MQTTRNLVGERVINSSQKATIFSMAGEEVGVKEIIATATTTAIKIGGIGVLHIEMAAETTKETGVVIEGMRIADISEKKALKMEIRDSTEEEEEVMIEVPISDVI